MMYENRAKYSRFKVVDNSKVLQYIALMQHKLCTRSRHRKHVTAKSFTSLLRTPLFYWNGPFRRKARETANSCRVENSTVPRWRAGKVHDIPGTDGTPI